ncbi:MAG: O-antigen ligase family protein [Candidatus Dormiibacterota bacterium]
MGRVLGRLGDYLPAAVALALPTVFLPIAEDTFILPRVSIVVAGACLGVGLAMLAPGGPSLGAMRRPLAAAALAAILAFVFSISWALSFAGSYTRYESLPVRLAYVGLFAAAVWLLRNQRSRDWVIGAFVLGTSIACIEALQQWAAQVPFRPDGNLGNANVMAALIVMSLPLSVARTLRGGRFVVAWGIGALVMVGGLVATTSRSGGLGALAALLILVVFSVRMRLAVAALIASVSAVGTAVLVIALTPLRALNDDPPTLRLHLWQDGLHMIAARPITGWGEDATGLAFGKFLSQDYASLVTFDRVHSGPLDVTAMQGLLGLAATGWVLALLFRHAWRWRSIPDVGALSAACAGYAVWVFVNFDWAPATGALWLLAGTAWAAIRQAEMGAMPPATTEPALKKPTPWRSGIAIALAFAAIGLGVMPLLADVWYLQGRAQLSVVVDPLQARYHWAVGQALVAQGSLAAGTDELRRAADLGETEPGLYLELGDRDAQLGRTAQARSDYRRALEIDPYYTPARERLAAAGS